MNYIPLSKLLVISNDLFALCFADPDVFEFHIVSLDNKQWYFEANSCDERDEWVAAIEHQILTSLQGNDGSKKSNSQKQQDDRNIDRIKHEVPGNQTCVDCDAPSKLKLQILIPILLGLNNHIDVMLLSLSICPVCP